jgi:CCR4-NOT transcription complex subunit 1
VHEDLFARLIVYYFTGNASSVFVFTKFWKAKPELFKKNIVELYNNDPTALTRILAFVHELKVRKRNRNKLYIKCFSCM